MANEIGIPSFIGQAASGENANDPKWEGSHTNKAEAVPPSLIYNQLNPQQQMFSGLSGPSSEWIDNRTYGSAPYQKPVDYGAVNRSRLANGTMMPVPVITGVANDGVTPEIGTAAAWRQKHQYTGLLSDSPSYIRNGPESTGRISDNSARLNGYYPGLYLPSSLSTLSHEVNHVNNMPTLGYSSRAQAFAKTAPGFSSNTYPGDTGISDFKRTAEALQSLASRKRSVYAETGELISTPPQMASSLQQLHDRQDGRPVLGEEHRLGNYLRTSTRDYDNAEADVSNLIRNTGGPVMGPSMDRILKSPREGFTHPAIKNITETYREAIPDLVRSDIADTPADKIAHILGVGRVPRFGWRRPK